MLILKMNFKNGFCTMLGVFLLLALAGENVQSQEARTPRKTNPAPGASAGADYRGATDLIVCSQNLKLFGTYALMKARAPGYKMTHYESKVEDLVQRFKRENCDVIAVQEVMGKNEEEQKAELAELVKVLRRNTGRVYESRVAPPAEGAMTTGFLVATDRAEIMQAFSYASVELPRIDKKQKPRSFSRTPLEIQLAVSIRVFP